MGDDEHTSEQTMFEVICDIFLCQFIDFCEVSLDKQGFLVDVFVHEISRNRDDF